MAAQDVTSVVSEFEEYVTDTEVWLEDFITKIGWTKDDFAQAEEKVQCELSSNHFVPVTKMESHVQRCRQVAKGYSKEDLGKDQSTDYFYEKATTVVPIKLESTVLSNLLSAVRMANVGEGDLPQTVERYLQELSPAERLKVYEYCMETAKRVNKSLTISEEELMLLGQDCRKKKSGPKSRLAILAEERDYKRRRQSYKGKSVHTGKKSHLQVLREVIESQMELVKPGLGGKEQNSSATPQSEDGRQEKAASEHSVRSSSRSRDDKPKRKHRKRSRSRCRSRDRERSRSKHRQHKKKKHKDR